MNKLSFINKIELFSKAISNYKFSIVFLILLIFLGILLLNTNKKNQKISKIIYYLLSISIIAIIIFIYHDSIGKMSNYMMNNFFIAVFFPNLAIYMAALIATNIILFISIFSFKSSKQIKIINVVIYVIMTFIFLLFLNTINQNNLDIYNQTSIYGNNTASALISLSSSIFILWIIFLIIYKILLIYLRKDYKPKVKKIIIKKKIKKLPDNFIPKESPKYIYECSKKEKDDINTKESNENDNLKEIESMFTLEDYKILLKMLNKKKEEKNEIDYEYKEEENKNNQISLKIDEPKIDDNKLKKHIVKEKTSDEIINDKNNELKKYNELLELYGMH